MTHSYLSAPTHAKPKSVICHLDRPAFTPFRAGAMVFIGRHWRGCNWFGFEPSCTAGHPSFFIARRPDPPKTFRGIMSFANAGNELKRED
jgi:hypothetical protein